jgi:hypothetical protein
LLEFTSLNKSGQNIANYYLSWSVPFPPQNIGNTLNCVPFSSWDVMIVNVSWRTVRSETYRDTDRHIDLFILKNMGAAAIIDFRVCPPLVKCQHFMFLGFIDTLMYGFSSTGVTIYCYFGLKFNDNTCCEVICQRRYNDNDLMTTNKLPGMYFSFLITVIFPIQNQYKPTW